MKDMPEETKGRMPDLEEFAFDELIPDDRQAEVEVDAETWGRCDACDVNVGQVEIAFIQTASTLIRTSVRKPGREGLARHAATFTKDYDEEVYDAEHLCHGCALHRFGGGYLDALGVTDWLDTPADECEPLLLDPQETEAWWERRHAARRDLADRRRLNWELRNDDMFAEVDPAMIGMNTGSEEGSGNGN